MAEIKRYEDIPELTDAMSHRVPKTDYTYIINAEKYQQTGEVEIKRVLKADLAPEASVSYIFFKREGCQGYPLVEKDLYIQSRGYVGPFQMDDAACNAFLKKMKEDHSEWKNYFKGSGRNGYMNFVKACPDKEALLKVIEEYALSPSGYFNNRAYPPQQLAESLALHFHKTDNTNAPDSTRLPLHAIASLPTGVIAHGNGGKFKKKIPLISPDNCDAHYISWISDHVNGAPAYNKLKQINYLTPEIITQYQVMGLSGADNLQQQYLAQVSLQEESREAYIDSIKIKPIPIAPLAVPDFEAEIYARTERMDFRLDERENKKKTKNKNNTIIIAKKQSER